MTNNHDKSTLIDVIKTFNMGTGNDFLPLMTDITKYANGLMNKLRTESNADLDGLITRFYSVQEEIQQEQNQMLEELELLYDKAAMNRIFHPDSPGLSDLKTFTLDIEASMTNVRNGVFDTLKKQQSNAELEFAHEKICATMFLYLSTSAFLKAKALSLITATEFPMAQTAAQGMEKFLNRMGVQT